MPAKPVDLSSRPPRSPRVRLGRYVILPRMLDKGRALLNGKIGEYQFACPLDQRFLDYAGIDPEALKKELAAGKGDGEILTWIQAQRKNQAGEAEIEAWSAFQEKHAPSSVESREFFTELHANIGPKREDISNWFDLLDLDDYVTFGGQA